MEHEPKIPEPGNLLSDRLEAAPRELVPAAAWLDSWKQNPIEAIGKIFDMDNKRGTTGSQELFYLLSGEEPVIPLEKFEEAGLEWLEQNPHDWYKYEQLYYGLETRDGFLCPKIFQWFMDNLENLKKIPGPAHHAWSNLLEHLEDLKQGKSPEDLRQELRVKRKAAHKKVDEE